MDPVPGRRRFILAWALALLAISLVVVLAFEFDASLETWISSHQDPSLKGLMKGISRYGDWIEHFALGLVLLVMAWWRGNNYWTRVFLSMLIALCIAGMVGRAIKISTGRARPSVTAQHVWNGPRWSSKYHAFPSGHAAISTAFFGVLLFVNWRIGLPCLLVPVVVGFSRIYLKAHYLSDIIVADVLGILCAYLVTRLMVGPKQLQKSTTGNVDEAAA